MSEGGFKRATHSFTLTAASAPSASLPVSAPRRKLLSSSWCARRTFRCAFRLSDSIKNLSLLREAPMKRNQFPAGRNQAVLEHYEGQTEDEAVAEDETAFRQRRRRHAVTERPSDQPSRPKADVKGPGGRSSYLSRASWRNSSSAGSTSRSTSF